MGSPQQQQQGPAGEVVGSPQQQQQGPAGEVVGSHRARPGWAAWLESLPEDVVRETEARHSQALVSFLRSDLGFRGLLGRTKPPSTFRHPSLTELCQYPFSLHGKLVSEAMEETTELGMF